MKLYTIIMINNNKYYTHNRKENNMSRRKKKWSEIDYYDIQNPSQRYRKPYDYGGYHNPQYNQRVNAYKDMHIDSEDFAPEHGMPVAELEKIIPYPDPPREFDRYYTKEDYDKKCRIYRKRYKKYVNYPEGSPYYMENLQGLYSLEDEMEYKKRRADSRFYDKCKKYWNKNGIKGPINPIYFTEENKVKQGLTT